MKTYSLEHQNYLKKIRRESIFVILLQITITLLFLIIWEFLSKNHIINSFLFSSPSKIISTLYHLVIDGKFFPNLLITLYEVLISFVLSLGLGLFIATLLWNHSFLAKVFDPFLTILNSLPKVALGPLIIIWFGAGVNSIIFMSLMISVFVTIINIYHGFIHVPKNYITMITSFGAKKNQIFRYVIFPYNRKTILSTLKVNISLNLIGVIMGELLVSKKGLGYLIMYGSQVFHIDLVMTCIIVLAVISYFLYLAIQRIK
jgi:NitT/TauT family transport system permease protein